MSSLDRPTAALFTIFIGIMAGFFFAFTNPVMMGFANSEPAVYVAAMQDINLAVRNPTFGLFFFGTLPLGALAVVLSRFNPWLIGALVLYAAGFVLTVTGNVPMNDVMAAWTPETMPGAAEIEAFRARWEFLNTTRTILSILAMACGLAYAYRVPLPRFGGVNALA